MRNKRLALLIAASIVTGCGGSGESASTVPSVVSAGGPTPVSAALSSAVAAPAPAPAPAPAQTSVPPTAQVPAPTPAQAPAPAPAPITQASCTTPSSELPIGSGAREIARMLEGITDGSSFTMGWQSSLSAGSTSAAVSQLAQPVRITGRTFGDGTCAIEIANTNSETVYVLRFKLSDGQAKNVSEWRLSTSSPLVPQLATFADFSLGPLNTAQTDSSLEYMANSETFTYRVGPNVDFTRTAYFSKTAEKTCIGSVLWLFNGGADSWYYCWRANLTEPQVINGHGRFGNDAYATSEAGLRL